MDTLIKLFVCSPLWKEREMLKLGETPCRTVLQMLLIAFFTIKGAEMEHRIESGIYRLAGIQRIIKLSDGNIGTVLEEMRTELGKKIDEVDGLPKKGKLLGYWQVIDGDTRVYFMGVPVQDYEQMKEDYEKGFLFWDLGTRRFVAFSREEPTSTAPLYKHLPKNVKFDRIFIGDFEVWDYSAERAEIHIPKAHEVWIPIKN